MAAYPFLVQTAWNTLAELLRHWQREPFRWSREIEIQAELGGRLSQVFALQGRGTVSGAYGHGMKQFDDVQSWNRVGYEPYVPYLMGGTRYWCHPDIVIWDDAAKDLSPDYAAGATWPIAWACELKFGSNDDGSADVEKLRALIDQGRIRFGCSVNVHFSPSCAGTDIDWSRTSPGSTLWVCNVNAPSASRLVDPRNQVHV